MFRLFRSAYLRRWLRYNSLRKGLLGRQAPWLFIFIVRIALKRSNKILKRGEMPVRFTDRLEPGATYLISHIVPPTRRELRRARRSTSS